jgi:hypothetical protein
MSFLPIIFRKKRVELGDGHITQYTIFESKYLFSIILYNWKTIRQNRFHSHAFSALAFLLRGQYEEETYSKGVIKKKVVNQWLKPRFLPQHYCHRILKADPHTWTLVLVGPWSKYWYEFFDNAKEVNAEDKYYECWVKYTWGRKVISKQSEDPKEI